MSTEGNSSNSHSNIAEPVQVRISSPRRWSQSSYKSAYAFVSSRIYWKVSNRKPQSLIGFRNVNSLELARLDAGEWCDVEETIKEYESEGRICISIPGLLHGPKRRRSFHFLRHIELEIVVDTSVHEEMLDRIRALIVPWKVFLERAQQMFNPEPTMISTDDAAVNWSNNRETILDQMERLKLVDELIAQSTAAVGAGATFAKLVEGLKCVATVAGEAADISRVVSGASAAFHLVKVSTQIVLMAVEARRGRRVLPVALHDLVKLFRYVLKDMIEIVVSSNSEDEVQETFVFNVLEKLAHTMDMAETQLLRGRFGQCWYSEDVKKVKENLDKLVSDVVLARTVAELRHQSEMQTKFEEQLQLQALRIHYLENISRPSAIYVP